MLALLTVMPPAAEAGQYSRLHESLALQTSGFAVLLFWEDRNPCLFLQGDWARVQFRVVSRTVTEIPACWFNGRPTVFPEWPRGSNPGLIPWSDGQDGDENASCRVIFKFAVGFVQLWGPRVSTRATIHFGQCVTHMHAPDPLLNSRHQHSLATAARAYSCSSSLAGVYSLLFPS
jgi:hypothetical protein